MLFGMPTFYEVGIPVIVSDQDIMLLPNAEQAVVNEQKLIGYCLNPNHEKGRHKARVFRSALGFTMEHYDVLKSKLLNCVLINNAFYGGDNGHGQLYSVDALLDHEGRSATVRSTWIIMRNESFPRLVSCYVIDDIRV